MRGAVIAIIAAGLAASACGPDSVPFAIQLHFERDPTTSSFACGFDSCANAGMSCDARMLIRIADNEDASIAYMNQCYDIGVADGGGDLCALGDVELPSDVAIPNTRVRIQVAVWPLDELPADIRNTPRDCPEVDFDHQNQIALITPEYTPALAGIEYFEVGSRSVADVTLGCIDEGALDKPECAPDDLRHVIATVEDFETLQPPPANLRIDVSAGEPQFSPGVGWVLPEEEAVPLGRTVITPVPLWEGDLPARPRGSMCVTTLERNVFQAATSLHCHALDGAVVQPDGLHVKGYLVDDLQLDAVEQAIGNLPSTGIVLGRVIDELGAGVAGATVTPSRGTVQYLSDDMTSTSDVNGDPLTATTSSGAFVSVDAQFGDPPTTWTATKDALVATTEIAGIVQGTVSVVVLEVVPPE